MISVFNEIDLHPQQLYSVNRYICSYFSSTWHFHHDYELVIIKKGRGRRHIGDSIQEFGPGDVVLTGPGIPHVWMSDTDYYQDTTGKASECVVIHLRKNILNEEILLSPDFKKISELLYLSVYGILFSASMGIKINKLIHQIEDKDGIKRYLLLLELFNELAQDREKKQLAHTGYVNPLTVGLPERLTRVYTYLSTHVNEKTSLEKISQVANMSKASFCRYLKQKTNKTFIELVNEFRIGYAVKLIQNSELSTSEIAWKSGFGNLSHFNEQFKRFTSKTPREYRKISVY